MGYLFRKCVPVATRFPSCVCSITCLAHMSLAFFQTNSDWAVVRIQTGICSQSLFVTFHLGFRLPALMPHGMMYLRWMTKYSCCLEITYRCIQVVNLIPL